MDKHLRLLSAVSSSLETEDEPALHSGALQFTNVSSVTSVSVGLWRLTSRDQTPALPPSSGSLVSRVLLSAEPEGGGPGGWERRESGWFGDMVCRDLCSGNMLEKHLWWAWRFLFINYSKRYIEMT